MRPQKKAPLCKKDRGILLYFTGMFRGKVVGAALCGRPEETAGAGALSAKHEEIPLGYPRPTVNWLLCGTLRTAFPTMFLIFPLHKEG